MTATMPLASANSPLLLLFRDCCELLEREESLLRHLKSYVDDIPRLTRLDGPRPQVEPSHFAEREAIERMRAGIVQRIDKLCGPAADDSGPLSRLARLLPATHARLLTARREATLRLARGIHRGISAWSHGLSLLDRAVAEITAGLTACSSVSEAYDDHGRVRSQSTRGLIDLRM